MIEYDIIKVIEVEMIVKAGDLMELKLLCGGDVGGWGVGVTVKVRLHRLRGGVGVRQKMIGPMFWVGP